MKQTSTFRLFVFLVLLMQANLWSQRTCDISATTANSLNFENPVFVSGSDNGSADLGDVYRFSNVITGIDALVTITNLGNNATLPQFDRPAVTEGSDGFDRAFQPTLRANGTATPFAFINIQFVETGTTTQTPLIFYATALDVDGDGGSVRELTRFYPQPDSFSYNNPTGITFDFTTDTSYLDGIATTSATEPGTGTSPQYAYTNYFEGVSSFDYVIANVNATTGDRQFSLLFEDITYTSRVTRNLSKPVICGTVKDDRGVPLAGVTVNLSGAETQTTTTGADGKYSFTLNKTGITTASSYTITEVDPAGYISVSDADGGNDNSITRSITNLSSFNNDFTDGEDFDGDGITNGLDDDDDNDGITDCVEKGLEGADFNDVFVLNGSAQQSVTDPNEVVLTTATGNQSGQTYGVNKVNFARSFSFSFQANLGTKDGNGADGIAIIFHNDPNGATALGADGIGMGSNGIANGIVLEMDTFDNGTGVGDIPNDHTMIWDSDNQTGTGLLSTAVDFGNLEDGAWHDVVVSYSVSSQTIVFTVDGIAAGSFTGDLVNNYFGGASEVYFGYTASTGGFNNQQRIRFADFCDVPFIVDTDNDGTPDFRDTDSDNDGCFDALEGDDTSISLSSIDNNGALTGGVDANGVPTAANGGQQDVSSKDDTVTSPRCDDDGDGTLNGNDVCPNGDDAFDADGDGVPDSCDLDDDNDGLLDATEGADCAGTISYEFYDSAPAGSTVDNIPTTGATQTGTVSNFDVDALYTAITPGDGDNFSVRYTGTINIATLGTYTFYTNSDDGSKLLIDGVEVVNNDGGHAPTEVSGTIDLSAGIHVIQVLYFEIGGGEELSVSYEGPSIAKQALPFGILACYLDTDSDGTPDYLDTDSDNDGCFDALEGDDATISLSSIDGNGALTGGVDANGIPTAANGGQDDVSSKDNTITSPRCDDDGDGVTNENDVCNGYDDNLDNDGDGVPNACDNDDDNDGIRDLDEMSDNILVGGGFDNIDGLFVGNNFSGAGAGAQDISPWQIDGGFEANVVRVDGSGAYGNGGPALDARNLAGNYLDIVGGSNEVYQVFTLAQETKVIYAGYFSARDGLSGTGYIKINAGSGLAGATVDTSPTITSTSSSEWSFVTREVTLPAGTYTFVFQMDENMNFDEGGVYAIESLDTDGDGVPNIYDLDSDNDGIYDAEEAGHNQPHTNGVVSNNVGADGVPNEVQDAGDVDTGKINYAVQNSDSQNDDQIDAIEIDSDNDGCFDVIEAGYTDDDGDGEVDGTGVDSNGVVQNSDGYGGTNANVTTAGSESTIDTQPSNQSTTLGGDATFTVTASGGSGTTQYQWEVSTDNGSTFVEITDTGIYSGTTTNTLTLTGVGLTEDDNQYRVIITQSDFVCALVTSDAAILNIINSAPIGLDDTNNTNEDTTLTVAAGAGVLSNDTDVDGDTLSVDSFVIDGTSYSAGDTANLTEGDLTLNSDGSYVFVPASNFNGVVPTVTYTVTDGTDTDTADLDITVTAVNDAPVAVDDTNSTAEDTTLTVAAGDGVLFNDTDVEGNTLSVDSFVIDGTSYSAGDTANLTEGDLTLNADGSYVFVPASNFNGVVPTVTYTVTDGTDTDTADLDITVTAVNDAPVAVNDTNSTAEDTTLTVAAGDGVLFNDTDVEGNTLSVDSFVIDGTSYSAGDTANLTEGDLTLNADGSYVFVPASNFNGVVPTVTYTVTDGTDTDTADLDITVTAVNDAPVAVDDTNSTAEDTTLTVAAGDGVLFNDTDVEGNTLSVDSFVIDGTSYSAGDTANLTEGDLILNSDGSYVFVPASNFNGVVPTVTYTVTDGTDTDTADLDITVTAVNDAPVAVDDTNSTAEDTTLTVAAGDGVLFNDTDVEGNTLSVDSFVINGTSYSAGDTANLTEGDLTLNSDGSYVFVPASNFNGVVPTVTYTVTDGTDTDTADLDITVTAVNDAPVAVDDTNSTAEDTTLTVAAGDGVLFNDTDVEGNTLSVDSFVIDGTSYSAGDTANLTEGDLTLNSDGSYVFVPASNFNGVVPTVTYTVTDGTDTDTADLDITVTAVNDAPVAVDDTNSTAEDTTLTVAAGDGVLFNDTDVEGNTLSVDSFVIDGTSYSAGDTANLTEGDLTLNADGSYVFVPASNFNGVVPTVTYTVTDGTDTDTADLDITVTAVNDAPVAVDDTNSTAEDTTLTVAAGDGVLFNDTDVEGNTLSVDSFVIDGTSYSAGDTANLTEGDLTLNADGSYVFVPASNFNGVVPTVTYTVTDGTDTDTADLDITVTAVNDAPVAVDDTNSTAEDTTLTVAAGDGVLFNDTDVEGNTLSVDSFVIDGTSYSAGDTANLTEGDLTLNADGSYVFVPASNFNGVVPTVTYTVTDGTDTDTADLDITVTAVNDAPVAVDDTETTYEDNSVEVLVLVNDTDVEGDSLAVTAVTNGTNGTVVIDAITGNPVYTPNADFNGTDTFTYTISDGQGGTDTATVTVTILPTVDAFDDLVTTENETAVIIDVLDNDGDVPTTGSLTISSLPANGTVTILDNGTPNDPSDDTVQYTPNDDFFGNDTFEYTICDDNGNCDTASVTVTVEEAVIEAVDDDLTSSPVNGYTGATAIANVLDNDLLNNQILDPAEVSVTPVSDGTLSVNLDGTVDVSPLTPAGTYTIDYTICENANPSNCSTATVTVNVASAEIIANDDDFSATPVNGIDGGIAGDVTDNDTLNGQPVDDADISITLDNNGGLNGVAIDNDGTVSVPANTPAGTYTVTYTICENLNPTNCESATVTIVVDPAVLVANDDDFSATPVNGIDGGIAGDVTDNDTLNGQPVDDADISITLDNDGGLNGVSIDNDGTVSVPANTPAGTYTVTYTICENLNPTNCESASITVVVDPAVLVANEDDFSATPVNGIDGGIAGDVTDNDTLNGQPVDDADISITLDDNGGLNGVSIDNDGTVSVPANTPAGTYTVTYTICENLNPTNCESASITVVVDPATLVANDDDFSATPVNGIDGGIAGDVTDNDTLNGQPVDDADISITLDNDGGLNGVSIDNDGTVSVPANTPAGTYTITYTICENLNPTNCESATVTIVVDPAVLVANDDDFSATPINGIDGGIAGDVTDNDTLNGQPVDDADISITLDNDGGLSGVSIDNDGTVSVPANTPAGTYTITYTICENLNPTNCESATVTIVVDPAVLVANDDDFSATPINGIDGGIAGDVTDNDTLNGQPVDDADISITLDNDGGLSGVSIDNDGTVSVPANTPAGTYTVSYTICENLNPTNCESASITVVLDPAVLVANDDDFSATPVNGIDGGIAGDVTDNDTLNGQPVDDADISITLDNNGGLNGVSIDNDGTVSVPANTPAGTYTISYTICENLNPTNCESASITVVVDPATLVANDDDFSATPVNGIDGGIAGDVTDNDTLNGQPVDDADISITLDDDGGLNGVSIDNDGTVSVPANTPAGTYTVTYTICENLNPTNCESATVTIVVDPATLVANDDDFSATPVNGIDGGIAGDVTDNDTLNGQPVDDADISITLDNDGGLNGVSIDNDGTVSVPANTPAGTYTVTYTICENLNPTNCESASITVVVDPATLVANDDDFSASPVNGIDGDIAGDVTDNDTLNGQPVDDADISITLDDDGGLNGVSIDNDGTVSVPANTPAGTYTVTYTICENLNPTNCESATVTVVVDPATLVANDDDFSATPVNGINGGIAGDVTDNDTLNGQPVDDADISITLDNNGGLNGVSIDNDGTVSVPANTPAGTYTISYTICENLNPSNCSTATVTVNVASAEIIANDDEFSATAVNGIEGGIAGDVTDNDTLNGQPVDDADISITLDNNGGLNGVSIDNDGTVSVPANTPAGTYTITYTICENLNPTNCESASITVVVDPAVLVANDDDFSATPVNGIDGGIAGDVTDNDTLNGQPVDDADISITLDNDGGLNGVSIDNDGTVSVPANTPAGTYTVTYTICENLNPTNCESATVTVVVDPATLVANDDDFSATPVNGIDGGIAGDVTDNDTLNGQPVDDADISITLDNNGGLNGVSIDNDGTVSVPANTPAGTYTITYTICENLNPTNCESATVTIVVDPAVLVANDDDFSATPINGIDGGIAGDVTDNDTLNGQPVDDADISITLDNNGGLNGVSIDNDGTVSVPANTPAGTYTISYTICENLNPTNCESASITIVVDPATLVANDDDFSATPVNGIDDGIAGDVTDNDTLNGQPVDDADISITLDNDGGLNGVSIDNDGTVSVPANTPAGTYTVTYTICENLNPTNCETATVTVVVDPAVLVANDDDFSATPVNGIDGGIAGDVTDNDTLNGQPVDDADISITLDNNGGLNGVSIDNDGSVSVPANTPAGTYTVTYTICENLNPTNCESATVTIVVDPAVLVANDDDFSATPVNGIDGGIAGDVTANDTLNGQPVDDADIFITNDGGLNGASINNNGDLVIPQNTPAGIYTVTYTICETLNPGNCSSASITVNVASAEIIANDDDFSATPVNGIDGGIAGDVTDNDTLNGQPVDDADISITLNNNGGLNGVSIDNDGTVSVPANTPAGTYTITYTICENLNPTNCESASITVVVDPATLVANDDDFSATPVNGIDGGIAGDVTANDTLNGQPVDDADIFIVNNGGLSGATINNNGDLIIPANTPAGTYTVTYSICETLNPTNCDSATITVEVSAATLVANNDDFGASPIAGQTGGIAGDVTTNDTLNGQPVDDADISITLDNNGGLNGVSINNDGTVDVPANTPAGTYTITYTICENLNAGNCDSATAIIVVDPADVVATADDFSATPVNGLNGGVAGDVTANDLFNGQPVDDRDVFITDDGGLPGASIDDDGNLIVAPGSPAGTYTVIYTICENLNPGNCDSAAITVVVSAAELIANNDDFSATPIDGYAGDTTASVFVNDTYDGASFNNNEVVPSILNNDGLTGLTINADGSLTIPEGIVAGTYTVVYQICEALNPSNCASAEVILNVLPPAITANDDDFSAQTVNGIDGGSAGNVFSNDTVNTVVANSNDVTVSVVNDGGIGGLTINANGVIQIPAGTPAGTYIVNYQICDAINPANCDTADAIVVIGAGTLNANDDDFSANTINGYDGGSLPDSILDNDLLNGVAVNSGDVTITLVDNGGLTGLTIDANGFVTVPSGIEAGTYSVVYQLCENLNGTNCDSATITIVITAPVIDAVDDDFTATAINGFEGGSTATVLGNDTLNTTTVAASDVNLTLLDNGGLGGLILNADGTLSVPAGTSAGDYTVQYQICDAINTTNCDIADAIIRVTAPVINAVDDDFSTNVVDGANGGTSGDVTLNDTLNGVAVNDDDIDITLNSNGGINGLELNNDGSVVVPRNTASGTYTIQYTICENLNSANCSTAEAIIVVGVSTIVANDDDFSATPVNGIDGGIAGDVTDNDTLNGQPVDDADISITLDNNGGLSGVSIDNDGTVSVPANTPAGTYTVTYTICENLNPTNCESATVTIVVDPAVLVAYDDDFSATPVNGIDGGIAGDVTDNDTLNGQPVDDADIFITNDGGLNGASINNNGDLVIPQNTPAGIYTVTYTICETLNPGNCSSASITVNVAFAEIIANDDDFSATPVNGIDGGIAGDVTDNDTLNGQPVDDADISITLDDNGGLNGVSIDNDGTVSVPANTPAGTYTVTYTICENLNPTNCESATVTIVVDPAVLVANDDDFSATPVNGIDGGIAGDVTANDTLNGQPVDDADIFITNDGGLNGASINNNGDLVIPQNTPAGIYTVTYTICETLNPGNCSSASITVNVASAEIIANDDDFSTTPVNGIDGGIAGDVTDNDTLNGQPVDDADISITLDNDGGLNGVSIDNDGTVSVPANTPAGTYTISYTICENLNPSNCSTATVTVNVASAEIIANDDEFSATAVNGIEGGIAGDVTDNDTLNGQPVDDADISITLDNNGGLNGVSIDNDGTVSVPANTPAGTYTITYTICENLNPTNCESASITVVVDPAVLVANDDDFSATPVNGIDGGIAGDVTDNDTLNGQPVDDADISITLDNDGGLNGVSIDNDGTVSVPANTPAGTYTVTYTICENLNPTNCESATVTVVVDPATLVANDDDFSATPVNGIDGGIAGDVTDNDTLNGQPVDDADISITLDNNGGLNGVSIDNDGTVSVPANTPAGTYTVTYTICENLNPTNCESATVTIVVDPAVLVANEDDFSATPVNGIDGGIAGDVTDNDTLNGQPVDDADISITLDDNGGLSGVSIDNDGTVSVPANTPAGTYTVTYTICENLNPTNCESASITVVVDPATLVANDDDFSATPVNGIDGGIAGDVTDNDTLNGQPVDDADISITLDDNGGLNGVSIDNDGTVSVPANTPAGTYTVTYTICENLNPTNCESASITVVVDPAVLVANDDDFSATPVNGIDGGIAGDVTDNDTLNGQPVDDADISITLDDNGGLNGVSIDNDGTVSVPANTPAGTYTISYTICENLNPTNCESASITVVVDPATLVASDDDFSATPVNGIDGGIAGDVTDNDTLNGQPVDDADISITLDNDGGLNGVSIDNDGTVSVPANTPAGTYTVTYTICENLNPTNCETATVTVVVDPAVLVANDDDFSATPVNGIDGGIAGDVTDNDTLNGQPVDDADISITLDDDGGLNGVSIDNDGTVSVPANTPAGTYTVTYTICENLNPTNCESATVTIVVDPATLVANDDDFSATPVNGIDGGIAGDVTDNDTLNGQPVDDTNISITLDDDGGLNGVSIDNDGTVSVPANTPAGTYTVTYTICENLNPTNCESATVTVVVDPATLVANDDDFSASPVNGIDGGIAGDVTDNDTLNGQPVDDADISITLDNNGGLNGVSIDNDGTVSVPANTPAGTYTINYTICENLNPTNCESASITVVVDPATLVANDDDFSATPVNGIDGGIAGDVTDNDTLNGQPVDDTNISITLDDDGGLNGVSIDNDGTVSVPANTPAGTYTVTYTICENLNPTNCESASITVVVDPATLVANDDDFSATPVNGIDGGIAGDVTDNDTLNGQPVDDADISITLDNNGGLSGVSIDNDGTVSVPANTPAGTYTVTYTICENLNPPNCESASITVVVDPATLVANDDDFSATPVNGIDGGIAGDVTDNDTLNGQPVDDADISITLDNDGGLNGVSIDNDGTVSVPANTPAGTYTISYTICENLNPTNCESASITVVVDPATLVVNDDDFSATPVNGIDGGIAGDVTANDTLNGQPVDDADISITLDNDGGLNGVSIDNDGTVSVPANTPAGTYIVTYTICENLNPTNCESASITVVVDPATLVANDDDFSATPVNGIDGGIAGDVTDNDTLNGQPVDDADISITLDNNGGLNGVSIDNDGTVSVPANTPAGTYTVTYTICENLNPTNCESATVTIVVDPAVLIANDDDFSATPVNGIDGGIAGDVTDNDTLNGQPVDDADISITLDNNGGLNGVSIDNDGTVSVPANTPAGTYTVTYTICENLNPTNCETAEITIVVSGKAIVADDDDFGGSPVNGNTGGVAGNIFANDNVDGQPVDSGNVVISIIDDGGLTGVTIDDNGDIIIPENSAPGTYWVVYSICDATDLSSCDSATVTLIVTAGNANLDLLKYVEYVDVNGDGMMTSGDELRYDFTVINNGDATINDITILDDMVTVNGGPISLDAGESDSTTFTATYVLTQDDIENGEVVNIALATGVDGLGNVIDDFSDDPSDATDVDADGDGDYEDPTVFSIQYAPAVELLKTALYEDANNNSIVDGGDIVRYFFEVINTGNTILYDVTIDDAMVTVTGGPIDLLPGERDTNTFSAIYTITAKDVAAGSVTNIAEVRAATVFGDVVNDTSDDPLDQTNNDIEGDGEADDPTVLNFPDGGIIVYNVITPNGDGQNEFFKIGGIEQYPDNTVKIFNRWGVLVFEESAYGQEGAQRFRGVSNGRATINKDQGLPAGTYYYAIDYINSRGESVQEAGYLYLQKQ